MNQRNWRAEIVGDPFGALPIGSSVAIDLLDFGSHDGSAIAQDVRNWEFFEGSLLSVGISTSPDQAPQVLGSAVVIAPGLAVTASHVFDDRMLDLLAGTAALVLFGIRDTESADVWKVREISYDPTNDLSLLAIELTSRMADGWRFVSISVSTRTPRPGEALNIVGFRYDEAASEGLAMLGDLYTAVGQVVAVYPEKRDSVLMPYPTIEVACGSLGGMSGGAVLDEHGALVGIISRGLAVEAGDGPTFASWIIGIFGRSMTIPWPPTMYPAPVKVLDIDQRLLHVHGREALAEIDGGFTYRAWSSPEELALLQPHEEDHPS